MPETWSHAQRESFVPHDHEAGERAQATRYFYDVLQSFQGSDHWNARKGSELGKAFVRVYEIGSDLFTPQQFQKLQRDLIAQLGEQQGSMYVSGFLTELAAASIFSELDFPTFYPLQEEDLKNGVDWWVDLSDIDNGAVALQVKAVPLKDGIPNRVLYPVRNENDVKTLLDALILPETLDVESSMAVEAAANIRVKILLSARNLMQMQDQYAKTIPALMILPSPNSDGAQFNTLTGKPNREVIDIVFNSLGELPRV